MSDYKTAEKSRCELCPYGDCPDCPDKHEDQKEESQASKMLSGIAFRSIMLGLRVASTTAKAASLLLSLGRTAVSNIDFGDPSSDFDAQSLDKGNTFGELDFAEPFQSEDAEMESDCGIEEPEFEPFESVDIDEPCFEEPHLEQPVYEIPDDGEIDESHFEEPDFEKPDDQEFHEIEYEEPYYDDDEEV